MGRRALVAALLLVASIAAVVLVVRLLRDDDGETATTTAAARRPIPGFSEVAFRVGADDWCAMLAATESQRGRGLMEQRDLGGYDGMLFEFPSDTTTGFWMRDTPLPLSIAWFAGDGSLVSTADMAPCADDADCPSYPPAGPYRWALEVPQGDLTRLGVRPGVRFARLTTPCPSS